MYPSLIYYILVYSCFLSRCADFEVLEIIGSDLLPLLSEIRVENRRRKNKVIEKVSEKCILD